MRSNKLMQRLILVATFAVCCNSRAFAEADEFSPADLALIKSYTLTTEFLEKWTATNQDPQVAACNLNALTLHAETVDERAEEYDARPGVHGALAANGLTAREVVLATTTLAVAGLQAMREKYSWLPDDGEDPLPVSAANVQFYREHATELSQLKQITRQRSRESRGKGVKCPR